MNDVTKYWRLPLNTDRGVARVTYTQRVGAAPVRGLQTWPVRSTASVFTNHVISRLTVDAVTGVFG